MFARLPGRLCLAALVCGAVSAHALTEEMVRRPVLHPEFPESVQTVRSTGPDDGPQDEIRKVLGGKSAKVDQFPWQVALIEGANSDPFEGFFCGGTLVAWRWVLTAAHCTYRNDPRGAQFPAVARMPNELSIYAGSINFKNGQRVGVARIVRHERYDPDSIDSDIALIELASEPDNKETLRLIEVASATSEVAAASRLTVVGWGFTKRALADAQAAATLQYADGLRLQPNTQCNEHHVQAARNRMRDAFKRQGRRDGEIRDEVNRQLPLDTVLVSEAMLCAGTLDGSQDACSGDSGGPLLVSSNQRQMQVGIVSWGPSKGCGLTNQFGVYVRLARYSQWITTQMNAAR